MTRRRRKATDVVYELVDLTVEEVSLVDNPAIGRTFLITKNIGRQDAKNNKPPKSREKAAPKPQRKTAPQKEPRTQPTARKAVAIPVREPGQTSVEYAFACALALKKGAEFWPVAGALLKDLQQQFAAQQAALDELKEQRRVAAEERAKALQDPLNRLVRASDFEALMKEALASVRPEFRIYRNGHSNPGVVTV